MSGGDQPLYNADRSVVLLYNGEIYNYWELRRELESKGHMFRTGSDGEVICHLYQHHGLTADKMVEAAQALMKS